MRSPWIAQWVLSHLREIQKKKGRQKGRREYNTGGGDWSDAGTGQGMPTTTRRVK